MSQPLGRLEGILQRLTDGTPLHFGDREYIVLTVQKVDELIATLEARLAQYEQEYDDAIRFHHGTIQRRADLGYLLASEVRTALSQATS